MFQHTTSRIHTLVLLTVSSDARNLSKVQEQAFELPPSQIKKKECSMRQEHWTNALFSLNPVLSSHVNFEDIVYGHVHFISRGVNSFNVTVMQFAYWQEGGAGGG